MTLIPPATDVARLDLPRPYLLFLGDVTEAGYAKTAFGLRDWARERCVGELSFAQCDQRRTAAADAGGGERMRRALDGDRRRQCRRAESCDSWVPSLLEALEAGLDIVSGMHARLATTPALAAAAERYHRRLIDVRTPPRDIPIASGRKRSGKRLLAVGTDCALGKKYTALAIARAFEQRGIDADFRATGQTGIMIAGTRHADGCGRRRLRSRRRGDALARCCAAIIGM